jgi:hypothetical protein
VILLLLLLLRLCTTKTGHPVRLWRVVNQLTIPEAAERIGIGAHVLRRVEHWKAVLPEHHEIIERATGAKIPQEPRRDGRPKGAKNKKKSGAT